MRCPEGASRGFSGVVRVFPAVLQPHLDRLRAAVDGAVPANADVLAAFHRIRALVQNEADQLPLLPEDVPASAAPHSAESLLSRLSHRALPADPGPRAEPKRSVSELDRDTRTLAAAYRARAAGQAGSLPRHHSPSFNSLAG